MTVELVLELPPYGATMTIVSKKVTRKRKRLAEVIRSLPEASVGDWVLAAASRQMNEAKRPDAPARWLATLTDAYSAMEPIDAARREACDRKLAEVKEEGDWGPFAFLGVVLATARAIRSAPREGRHGRKSEPIVYTPVTLARQIVSEIEVTAGRVLDPACGAGVFLLTYFEHAHRKLVEAGQASEQAARALLAEALCGVDLDPLAIALTRFSLRLAAWEAAGLREDVPINLRCADALEALEGLEGEVATVIGNPPFMEGRGLSKEALRRLRLRFRSASVGKVNLFTVFIERGLELLREGGSLHFIVPSPSLRNDRYKMLRFLLLEQRLRSIKPAPRDAFEGCTVETIVLSVEKGQARADALVSLPVGAVPQGELATGPTRRFCIRLSVDQRKRMAAMERKGVPLATRFTVRDGISTGFQPFPKRLLGRVDGVWFEAEDGTRVPFDARVHHPVIDGSEFSAFSPIHWEGRWIEYDKRHEHHPPHPGRPFNCQMRERGLYDRAEKLLTRQTARGLIATLDRKRFFVRNSVHVTFESNNAVPEKSFRQAQGLLFEEHAPELSLAALCACMNSKLYDDYFLAATGEDGAVYPQVHIADLRRLPILPSLLEKGGELEGYGDALLAWHAEEGRKRASAMEVLKAKVEALLRAAFEVQG